MLVLLSRFFTGILFGFNIGELATKIKIGDFFGSNIFEARAKPDI
jgi:hypothetical protein